jgi:hypothetical protein
MHLFEMIIRTPGASLYAAFPTCTPLFLSMRALLCRCSCSSSGCTAICLAATAACCLYPGLWQVLHCLLEQQLAIICMRYHVRFPPLQLLATLQSTCPFWWVYVL